MHWVNVLNLHIIVCKYVQNNMCQDSISGETTHNVSFLCFLIFYTKHASHLLKIKFIWMKRKEVWGWGWSTPETGARGRCHVWDKYWKPQIHTFSLNFPSWIFDFPLPPKHRHSIFIFQNKNKKKPCLCLKVLYSLQLLSMKAHCSLLGLQEGSG